MIIDQQAFHCQEVVTGVAYVQEQVKDENWEMAFEHIISVEGEKVAPPDSQGISKFGITKRAWGDFKKSKATDATIRGLTKEQARQFYYHVYWKGMKLDQVDSPAVAIALFDQLVHRGPSGGAEFIRAFINTIIQNQFVQLTGIMDPQLIMVINSFDAVEFVLEFFKSIQRSYIRLAIKDHKKLTYLRGWLERSYVVLQLLEHELDDPPVE